MDLLVFLWKKGKRAYSSLKAVLSLKSINGNAGFSLVGILVSSGIGLLVIVSINQVFIHLATRVSQNEDRYKKILFHSYIVDTLSDPKACLNTLGDPLTLDSSNELIVPAIKDNGSPPEIFDLTTPEAKKEMKTKYGIGDFQELKFQDYNATAKTAQLILIAKRLLHKQIPIYEQNTVFHLKDVEVSSNKVTGCRVIGSVLEGGGVCGASTDYYKADCNDKTLIGYDGPIDISGDFTTAVGYKAGSSSSTGANNTFLGYEAGTDNTSGRDNVLLGYQAGEENTSGEDNTYAGYQAGEENTSGEDNTYAGYRAGEESTIAAKVVSLGFEAGRQNSNDENTYVGYQAGENSQVGTRKTFIGYQAGQNISTGGINTFIGYEAGIGADFSATNNIFIGSGASDPGSNNIVIRAGSTNERRLHPDDGIPPDFYISKNSKQRDNNIFIGSFSEGKEKELTEKSDFLWIKDLIKGDTKEKWVSIQYDLDARNLYASLHSSSDKRLKREIKKLNHSLETINQLKAYRFKWKNVTENKKNKNHFGFMAQEVQLLTPEVVEKNRKGFLTVNYPELLPLLVSAFQEFQGIVKASLLKVADKLSKARKQVAEQLKIVDLKLQEYIKSVEESITKQLLEVKVEIEVKISEARVAMSGRLVDAEDITAKNTKALEKLNIETAQAKQSVKYNKKTVKALSLKQSGSLVKVFAPHKKELLENKKEVGSGTGTIRKL